MTRSVRVSLWGWLVAAVLVEVVLRRVVVRLLELHVLGLVGNGAVLYRAALLIGQFALTFSGVLALALSSWATLCIAADYRSLGRLSRVGIISSAGLLLSIAGIGLFTDLHPYAGFILPVAFALLLIALLWALVRTDIQWRFSLGWLYLVALVILRCLWLAEQQLLLFAAWPPRTVSWIARVYALSDPLLAFSGVVVLVAFAPLAPMKDFVRPRILAAGACALGLVVALRYYDYPLAELLAQRVFNLQLPPPQSLSLVLYLCAIFPLVLTLATLWRGSPRARASANGLLLIAMSGYHLLSAQQVLVTLVGMLQLMHAITPERHPNPLDPLYGSASSLKS